MIRFAVALCFMLVLIECATAYPWYSPVLISCHAVKPRAGYDLPYPGKCRFIGISESGARSSRDASEHRRGTQFSH